MSSIFIFPPGIDLRTPGGAAGSDREAHFIWSGLSALKLRCVYGGKSAVRRGTHIAWLHFFLKEKRSGSPVRL